MEIDNSFTRPSPFKPETPDDSRSWQSGESEDPWRKSCGCIKTSEKLRRIIDSFPPLSPPPPSPLPKIQMAYLNVNSSRPLPGMPSNYLFHDPVNVKFGEYAKLYEEEKEIKEDDKLKEEDKYFVPKIQIRKEWFFGVASLLHLCVTATALGLYYMLYCYMQLVYFTLKSALYFHHADGPMKVTIGVLTLTSLIVGFNILVRIEKLFGMD